MSHLRAPAARADRREGGRHGRPVARTTPSLPETHIRPHLLRLAVLPPTAVALSAVAAVLFTVRSTGARPGLVLWAVLAGAASVTLAALVTAVVAARRAARSVHDRIGALRAGTARREAELQALVEALRRGDEPPRRKQRGGPPADADEFELLAADLARAHDGAVCAVVQASRLSSQAGSEQKLEVFVNLARRLQSLVHREISLLDELENEIEDPDLLKGLFHVDHLATRIRRHAENLAVLGGAVSRRQWSNPVPMTEVLRSAIAEVEQYSRVKLVPPIDGRLRGHAVADVIHLLAELIENATVFSAPHTQVLLRAGLVTSGLAVEVEDRGLGMPVGEQVRMNALLADPDQVNVASLLEDGRIGLYVVSQLARRHGITVRLQSNIYGGVQAVLVVPQALLGAEAGMDAVLGEETGAQAPPAAAGARTPAQAPEALPTRQPVQPPVPGGAARPEGTAGRESTVRPEGTAGRESTVGPEGSSRPDAGPHPVGAGSRGDGSPGAGARAAGDAAAGADRTGVADVDGGGAQGARGAGGPGAEGGRDGAGAGARGVPGTGGGEPAPSAAPAAPSAGGAPAPLPRRGSRTGRPTPAEAVPGIRPEDRAAVAAHAGVVPTPRDGVVRGTMEKPQLPRRRAQEHLVPQLRGGPAPRQDGDDVPGHDPGLMAAFQRGIGLAEARRRQEPVDEAAPRESSMPTPPHGAPGTYDAASGAYGDSGPAPYADNGLAAYADSASRAYTDDAPGAHGDTVPPAPPTPSAPDGVPGPAPAPVAPSGHDGSAPTG
ncbi:hypothetical protein JCM12681A_10980 [Streptomyces mexicanus]